MVGPCGLEPQTSSVSRMRSNQLSYGPLASGQKLRYKQLGPKILIACKAHSATVSR
jgi:hypothetical protein